MGYLHDLQTNTYISYNTIVYLMVGDVIDDVKVWDSPHKEICFLNRSLLISNDLILFKIMTNQLHERSGFEIFCIVNS